MSESVQRDDQWSSLHDMVYFRYDEQRPALRAEGLILILLNVIWGFKIAVFCQVWNDIGLLQMKQMVCYIMYSL
jgi:hypothetical protein